MTVIVGGHETGLRDTSLTLLNRNDRATLVDPGNGTRIFVNVSNGNLMIQEQDVYLPSRGEDYLLVRTYNARGEASDAHQHEDARWEFTTSIRLDVKHDNGELYFTVKYGDDSTYEYRLDAATGLYVSTNGAGAFETIEDLGVTGNDVPAFILTRADQTKLSFDSQGRLLQLEDTNGVTVDYIYESDRLQQVVDDQGHVLNYIYQNGVLFQVTDETEGVLVEYHYTNGRLSEVIDRFGHGTQYFYTNDGFLERIVLPNQQTVNGQLETYENREWSFVYEAVNWRGNNQAVAQTVTQITDAEGNVTTLEYDFEFSQGSTSGTQNGNGKKLGHLKNGKADDTSTIVVTDEDKFFEGGTTKVVDALGNDRAFSNDQEYVDWRVANGWYATYDANQAATNPSYQAQVDAIRSSHSLTYSYRDDGYITEVVDQQGFHTTYVYDVKKNLTAVTNRNGWGATHSDSAYFRQLRAELGIVDAAGNGKLVATLSQAELDTILEAFTSHFEYDSRGNLTKTIDNADNVTTFAYTSFNKLDSTTSAVGNALVTSDAQLYQDKRVALGYAALVANLSAADVAAILDLHTTYFEYDANQNLTERRDAGGDITRFEYDSFGNQTKRTVFIDPNDLTDPSKQQVTTFAYDGFGNNVSTTDAEGHQTSSVFDHFGNLLSFTDGNGGVTQFTYDDDNRLLTVTDPEGHVTVNAYDAVGNRISVTDADGHTVTRLYDQNNNLVATIDPADTNPADDRVTQFEYDVVGNRTAAVDAEGRRTEITFNARREVVEVLTTTVPDQNGTPTQYASTFAYDGEGNRITATNNRGFTTDILYTQNNLIRQQTDPNGHVTRFVYDANNNQVSIIAGLQLPAAKRQILHFSYDEEDQATSHTDAEGNVTTFAYDAPGNRVEVTDANGNTTDFEFDGNNRLVREIRPEVTDPVSGNPVRYVVEHHYDANGNEIETVDENGHSTTFTFDRDDKVVMVEDGNGIKTVFEYDSRHNRTAVLIGVEASADAQGHVTVADVDDAQVTRFVYDEFNQLVAQIDGLGNALADSDAALYQALRQELGYAALVANLSAADRQALRALYTQHFTYDRVGNQLTNVDNLGRTTTFTYDGLNRLTSRTDAAGESITFRYDGNGNRTSQTDAEGRVTSFVYDSVDRLTDTTDPLGAVARRVHDDFGNVTSEIRAFGTAAARTSTFEYDLNNRVIAQTDPEGHTQNFEYDAVGNRVRVTDGRGNATQFFYDALNRNVRILDPLTFETRVEYDGRGNRISMIDARGGVTRLEYDAGDRYIATTDAEGRRTTFAYDVRDNRIEQRTAAGTADEELTVFEYDAENNLRRVIDAEGGVTTSDYDRVYNIIETTDANGNATTSEFDAVDRVIRVTDAEGGITQFAYDAVGNRLTQTDALGRVTQFVYDANDRLIRQIAANGVETHFAYDAVANRTSITRAANTADAATDTFTYDFDDRLIGQTDAEGNTTTFAYDANHNRTVVTDPRGNATVYTYDANNRVVSIEDPEANVVQYAYDGNGNRTQVTDARGFVSTTYYNANNEVVVSVDAEGFATAFGYDGNGNVVAQTLHMQALALPVDPNVPPALPADPDDQTTAFEYDRLNRVTARIDAEGYRTEFAYDAVGNRLETHRFRDLAGTDVAVTRSYYDDVNREIAIVTAEGYLLELGYDAVGNMVERTQFDERVTIPGGGVPPSPVTGDAGRTTAMVYDAVNQLVRETSPLGVHTDFEYDARGNRTAIVEATGTGDQRRTELVYDDANRLTDTIDALGTVTRLTLDGNGNVVERRQAFGTADERLTVFEYDGNNRATRQTDALGVVTETEYDANGNVVSITRAVGLPEARTEAMEYDGNNRLTATVNGEGERTESTYDGAGNRVRLMLAPGLPEERTNTFEFDRDSRLIASVDGEGGRTEYRYDGAGNKLETIQAVGVPGQERHSFYTYDLDNRVTRVVDPEGGTTEYEYDVLGNQTEIVDANGGVQVNTFDVLGRLESTLSAGGVRTTNGYDLRGNILTTTQSFADGSDARMTTYAYDLLDRQTRVTDPEGFSTTIQYDVFGNQELVTHGLYLPQPGDPAYDAAKAARAFPQTNTFAYDAADRLTSLTDGDGGITTYTYDAVGNRTSTTEAANSAPRTTTFEYDLANRLTETVTPEGGISRNTYDQAGNRVAESILQSDDGTTQVWINRTFEYDGNGRVTADIDPYGVRNEREYDAIGNQTVLRMAAGTADERITRVEYDLNNRASAEIDGEGNRTEYAYDSLGNRTRVTDALGRVARFYFDRSNNLTTVLDAEGFINAFSYDSAGNRTGEAVYMTRYTGPISDFAPPSPSSSADDRVSVSFFDRTNRLAQRVEADGSETRFVYDAVGNLLEETQFANTASARHLFYQYDSNNRLVEFTDVDGTVTTFGYDAANNKTSETITSATDPNAVRQTTFEHDLNNRLVRQVFDPSGLALVQTFSYDKVGNVVAQTDPNGNATELEYDLNNRTTRQIDALGNDTLFAYDAVGNQIAVTDANGNTTNFVYDGNNRVVQEIAPQVTIFTIDGQFQTLRPTIVRAYDAAGNEVQVVDASGFVTTRYFDSNDRVVAELNGDNALREYAYNAAGERTSETLYMTRLPASAHDPDARPAPPSGASRTTTAQYDLGGRVTRIVHPAVEVTTLVGVDTDDPSFTTATVQPEELFGYDAFGNQSSIIDRNGNRTLVYYDVKNRPVARVDAEGFLSEFVYDTQDNVLEQRIYTQPLDVGALDPNVRPTPPAGTVYQTNRIYDTASRLIEERSPLVEVFDPATLTTTNERVITRYTYDGVGNQLTRTLAAGSPQAFTEYTYFDALNRQVAVVDGNRVASTFAYDANGNQTLAKRFFNAVASSVDLTTLNGTTDFAALVGGHANDQALTRVYDALNRIGSETELMGAGSADDLIKSFGYDANGNRTRSVDADGFLQMFSFDAAGRPIKTVTPDGSGTISEYDVAGNQIFVFTGQLDGVPAPASSMLASLGDDLTISWTLPAGANVQSYVVYDTVSRTDLNAYANQSAVQGTWFSTSGSVSVGDFAAGQSVYFRVVTQDAAGSLTWTSEQVVTLPPRFTDVAVRQTGPSTLEVTVQFEAGAVNPQLFYGSPGATNTAAPLVDQGGGVFRATLNVTNPQELAYRISWQDAAASVYSSGEVPFEAEGGHAGVSSAISESTVIDGGNTFYRIQIDSTVAEAFAGDLLALAATWTRTDQPGTSGSASVEGVDSNLGYFSYSLVAGASTPLEAGTYRFTLRGVGATEDVVLDTFDVVVGSGSSSTERSVSWNIPAVGNDQVVIVDGVRVTATRDGDRLVVNPGLSGVGTVAYSAFYGTANADDHTTTVTSTEVFDTDGVTSLGFDVEVSAALSAAEAASVAGDVRLAWRNASSGTDFTNDVALTAAGGGVFETTLDELDAGEYDLKIYYFDATGNEVIVDWLRVDTADASTVVTAKSVSVEASETDGEITLNADEVITVDPGLYSGPVGDILDALSLATTATGNAGDSLAVDGSDTGYFTENQYNALNARIATNAETGLWRVFGVDANGNAVATHDFGLDRTGTPITTFTAYDGRDRAIARFAPVTTQHDSTSARAVTRFEYDVLDKVTKEIDARGGEITRTWNSLGSQLTETDQLLNTDTFRYDRLGRRTAETDALGNSRYNRYDTVGNLVEEIDGEGHSTTHAFDVFGRRIQVTNALGQSVDLAYDHRDRLISAEDALGFTTTYEYDGRDNRTRTVDANGHESRQVWDGLGRVTETVTFQNGQQVSEKVAYDAYGNLVSRVDAEGRVRSTLYAGFGRVIEEIDTGGRRTAFEYDDQGRVTREHSLSGTGKDIRRSYDDAGRLLEVEDLATGVQTVYAYDIASDRMSEATTTPGNAHNRSLSYAYDAIGQMVRWADSVTGMHTNYEWDAAGNLHRAFTDLGYDPDGEGLGGNTRFVDHEYTYDGNNRATLVTQRGTLETQYSYDAAGNRIMVNQAGTLTDYFFDANGRVERAESGGVTTADWLYDNVGNVTRFRTFNGDGSLATEVTKQYYENNVNYFTHDRDIAEESDQTTTLTIDRSGRVLRTKLVSDGDTFYFDHIYNAAGLEVQINARGDDVGGRTINTYNANDQLTESNKGQGDNQDRPEILRFVYNNDGQILYRFHDTGVEDEAVTHTEFAYANGHPVGQTGNTVDGATDTETLLDTGRYNLIQALGEDFPASTVTFLTAKPGDTLMSIAAAVYGNPSLWFVLAEANGLDPSAPLREGQRITIPNTIESGRITADTHVLYDESEIIGSTLPNLKSEEKDGCGGFLAILIVVVIAVIAAIFVPVLAGVFIEAGLGTIASFAAAGAIIGAAASIVQQGLFIALDYQDEFSWRSVAAGAVAGALSGAAQGIGQAIKVGEIVGKSVQHAKIAARALQVASAASKQLIESGKITSWASLAIAAVGPVRGTNEQGDTVNVIDAIGEGGKLGTVLKYVTPWLGAAESYIRTGKVRPADWASAIAGTLSLALPADALGGTQTFGGIQFSVRQTVINLAVGGVLSHFDKAAAQDFIANAIGNEVGNLIGTSIAGATGLISAAGRAVRNSRDEFLALATKLEDRVEETPEEQLEEITVTAQRLEVIEELPQLAAPSATDHQQDDITPTVEETRAQIDRYTVQPGDTLGEIVAAKYGKGFDKELILQIAALNGISNPNLIRADQTLTLPALGSELLASAPVTAELRSALDQTSGSGVSVEQVARASSATGVSAEQADAALAGFDEAIAEFIASGDMAAAAKHEEVRRGLQTFIDAMKASADAQRMALAGNSTLDNVLIGVGGFFVGLYDTGKTIVKGGLALAEEQFALGGDIASGLLNGGDFSAASARVEGYFDSAEQAVEFVKTAAEITQFVLQDDQLRGVLTQGAKDILGDINGDQVGVFAGQLVGELLLAVATAGAGTAASAARRGGTTALKLFDDLADLVRLTKRVVPEDLGPLAARFRRGFQGRLESAFAKIEPHHIGTGTETNDATRTFARVLGQPTDDAGHAIARNLGGSGTDVENIFPQSPRINRGVFRQFEQQIAREVEAGNEVFVRVVPKYETATATRPNQIVYQVRINGETLTRVFQNP